MQCLKQFVTPTRGKKADGFHVADQLRDRRLMLARDHVRHNVFCADQAGEVDDAVFLENG